MIHNSQKPEQERVKENNGNSKTRDMNIILSLEDKITENSSWCGTFNLIWNDLKNEVAKKDIEFVPQLDIVKNLNKGTFNTSYLSENSYYKTYGHPSLKFKEEIEKAIQKKFDETSDILDDFNWENRNPEDYFLYVMLKKQFEFASGEVYRIEKALQTIQFELDKKGGKIKSEAGIMINKVAIIESEEPREFLVNDTFVMFYKKKEKTCLTLQQKYQTLQKYNKKQGF